MNNNTTTMKHYQVICYFCTIKNENLSKLYKYSFDPSKTFRMLSGRNFEWKILSDEHNLTFQNDEEAAKWFHENYKSRITNEPRWFKENNIITGKEYELHECILNEDGEIEDTILLETSKFTPLKMIFTVSFFYGYEVKTSYNLNKLVEWVMEKNPKYFKLESNFDGDIFNNMFDDINDFTKLYKKGYITKKTWEKASKALSISCN